MSVLVAVGAVAPSASVLADDRGANRVTVAVIGDVPYGADQEATFGNLVDAINDDPKVRTVIHVGDTKNGSTTCTDERLLAVRDAFESFEDPLVYTPGDNEWTDCHRPAAGGYDPLERLAFVRSVYFAEPGSTLGRRPGRVAFQPELVEDVRWVQSRVAFATLHVVGSNNGLALWTGQPSPTPAQLAEVDARVAATVAWVDETFDVAERDGLAGVVLAMQADTFPTPGTGQQAVIDRITARAASFDGEVLLVQGDTHTYLVDHPLPLDNVTRIVVHGETLPFEYLRLTIDLRAPELFSWERVQVTD
jgi:Calcineurin-like phosphoesterase